jgi:hypothetical protein
VGVGGWWIGVWWGGGGVGCTYGRGVGASSGLLHGNETSNSVIGG